VGEQVGSVRDFRGIPYATASLSDLRWRPQPRYDGTELAKRGDVVVTVNYRLGPLGLFAHPALTAASKPDEPLGNYCLLDLLAALRWTQQNIAFFGGDRGNVTISGSSAGGTSCLFLMGSATLRREQKLRGQDGEAGGRMIPWRWRNRNRGGKSVPQCWSIG
jgi:carboxylesterase type B